MRTFAPRAVALTLAGLLAALLAVGCSSPTGSSVKLTPINSSSIRSLPADFFTRKAVCYSGYRGSALSTPPTLANIDQDLTLLKLAGYNLIRVFSSGGDGTTANVLQEIQNLGYDIKMQLGVGVDQTASDNSAEIAAAIKLANQYPSIIEAVSVGNETQVAWNTSNTSVSASTLVNCINQVRSQIKQPVTTDDDWAFYADSAGTSSGAANSSGAAGTAGGSYSTKLVLGAIDYVSFHAYPFSEAPNGTAFWDYQQLSTDTTPNAQGYPDRAAAMMAAAIVCYQNNFTAVKSNLASMGFGNLPIIVGETGWKANPTAGGYEDYLAHPVNQAMYLAGLAALTSAPQQTFYFEAFDEPWKGGDDGWGLFDVNRYARYTLYNTFPSNTTYAATNNGSPETITIPGNENVNITNPSFNFTPASALYYYTLASAGAITAPTYLAYCGSMPSAATASVAIPTATTAWYDWGNGSAYGGPSTGTGYPASAYSTTGYMAITPNSGSANTWGWGYFLDLVSSYQDLSKFSSGHLNFAIKTSYPGTLQIGFQTGSATNATPNGMECQVNVANGSYGYANDGSWHMVSIPVSACITNAVLAYGEKPPISATLTQVTNPFLITETFAVSNDGLSDVSSGVTDEIDVTDITWTQN